MAHQDPSIRKLRALLSTLPDWALEKSRENDIVLFLDKFSWVNDFEKMVKGYRRLPRPDPKKIQSRCPVYRALTPRGRLDLDMRMPGAWDPKSLPGRMLSLALQWYKKTTAGGVSPLTAIGLLAPVGWVVLGKGRVAPQIVIPEPVSFLDPKTKKLTKRRTERWHVLVWAMKRYCPISWGEITEAAADLNRTPASLRQTVRRNVEEPLAGFYRELTGGDLDSRLYKSALTDEATADPDLRRRMSELKKAVWKRRRRNPTE